MSWTPRDRSEISDNFIVGMNLVFIKYIDFSWLYEIYNDSIFNILEILYPFLTLEFVLNQKNNFAQNE